MDGIRATKLASVITLAAVSAIAAAPAHASTIYTLSDEYWLKAGTAFNTVWAGATGSAGTQGVYQETATGPSPIITQLTTTNFTGTGFGFYNAPVPGAFAQNDGGSALLLNGWASSVLFKYSTTTSLQINNGGTGTTITGVHNSVVPGGTGTNLNFQYLTGASVNAVTGVMTGTKTAFNFNSVNLSCAGCAIGFTLEGLLNGVVVDTASESINGYADWTTISPGWTNVDTIVFTNIGGSPGALEMRNINISPVVPTVPEPMTLALLGTSLLGLGMVHRKRA